MRPYTPILATLAYVMSPDRRSVLLIHRNKRPDDAHFGKYNGLGGKIEADEDVISGLKREIREEAGIEAREIVLRGTVSWPGFGKGGEDWFAFIFRIDGFSGTLARENAEGELAWVALSELDGLDMWESDRHWLSMVFDDSAGTFHGVAPFMDGRLVSWSCTRI